MTKKNQNDKIIKVEKCVQRLIQINNVLIKLSLEQLDIDHTDKVYRMIYSKCIYYTNIIYRVCTHNYTPGNIFIYFFSVSIYTHILIRSHIYVSTYLCIEP